jgi:hypothetical protein
MKVIKERPPYTTRCYNCNSEYEVGLDEVVAKVDTVCGEVNTSAFSYAASWNCPVCSVTNGAWTHSLPWEWEPVLVTKFNLPDLRQVIDSERNKGREVETQLGLRAGIVQKIREIFTGRK